jgi:ATP/maltotriose-dependent transcriptional regulator MalT
LRACTWLRENGFPEKAIPHAVSAGFPELAANIIESCAIQALGQSDFITFKRWISFLPDNLLRQRPLLWIYSAMTEVTMWNLDNAKGMLEKIKSILCESEMNEKVSQDQAKFHQQISALQVVIDAQSKNSNNSVVRSMQVMNDLSKVDLYTYGWFNHFIAYAYEDAGDLEAAKASFARSVEFVLQHNIPSGVISFCEIGRILKIQGRLREGERKYRQALDYALQGGSARELLMFAQWGLGDVLIEQNQFKIIDQWARDNETFLPDAKIEQYGRLFAMELYFRLANYYLFRDLEKSKFYLHKIRREFQEKKPFFVFQLLTDLQVKFG